MTPRTVEDADHRGGWAQIFVGKASEFQTAKVTLKVILKVTGNGAIRYFAYDFLLVFHCNYVSIFMLHRFRYIITYFPKFKQVTRG